jgi:tetratricopeptide (TPR) repeat protein
VSNLLIGLLGAVLATNPPAAVSNAVLQSTGISVNIPGTNNPAAEELKKLMSDDDDAMAEIDGWIRENQAFADKGGGVPADVLNARITEKLAGLKHSYMDFIARYTNYAPGYLAYGSFLYDTRDEEGAHLAWETSRELDPKNPAAWNELGNYYGHEGPITNAFIYYARAIELDPTESVYYQNLGTMVFLYRKDAREFYGINEQQVFNKALDLYSNAIKCDPGDFELAQDIARTYYGIQPFRTNDALVAWTNALDVATAEVEREGVYLHLARIKIKAGRLDEARRHLDDVTNAIYNDLKARLERNLAEAEQKARPTNSAARTTLTTTNGPVAR